jgi:transposase
MAQGNRGNGKAYRWLIEHASFSGDECLPWPFSRDWQGYGTFGYLGKMYRASRYMCEMTHGPAPEDRPFALHRCGNGHQGCCNPKHLYWGTPTENQLDRRRHGTAKPKGAPRQKLNDAQVEQIRALAAGGMKQYQIAERYAVRRETIGQILRGAWRKGRRPEINRLLDPPQRAAIAARMSRLRRSGVKLKDIAAEYKISISTVMRIGRQFGSH